MKSESFKESLAAIGGGFMASALLGLDAGPALVMTAAAAFGYFCLRAIAFAQAGRA